MFGSQTLETAIGLALMFFIFATAASAITEIYSSTFNKRAKDLEKALKGMLNSGEFPGGVEAVTDDEVVAFIKKATGRARASYVSAKSFADTASELVSKGQHLGGLATKLDALSREAQGRLETAKAGLETWFDQTMAAAQDKYSKWASFFLFFTGLALTVALNASVVNVASDLWHDTAAREAVVKAASSAEGVTAQCDKEGSVVQQAQCDVGAISTFQLPLGWSESQRTGWMGDSNTTGGWSAADTRTTAWWWLAHILGWLLTAALLMLGAPFWFDLLGKLVNLRAGGPPPKPAPKDDASYSTKVLANPPSPPDNDQWVPSSDQVLSNLIAASGGQGLTRETFEDLRGNERLTLYRDSPSSTFAPPQVTDSQSVDWLATALNLGVPMQVIRDRSGLATDASPRN